MFYLASENMIRIHPAKVFFFLKSTYQKTLNYSWDYKNEDFIKDYPSEFEKHLKSKGFGCLGGSLG